MPLQRKTPFALPVPADNSPVPAPLLTFKKQGIKIPLSPTGGLFSTGSIKFSLNNVKMVALAKEAFAQFSSHRLDADTSSLNSFLLSLSITSNFEGGFDSLNTYDKAGISVGFIQLARPEGGVGKLLRLIGRQDLSDAVLSRFGNKDPHSNAAALSARIDQDFLKTIITAVSSADGIKNQFAMAINQNVAAQFYFDLACSEAQAFNLKEPLCTAMLFDAAVNMGVGSLKKFKAPTAGKTDGDWLAASTTLFTRPERKKGWDKIVAANFV